MKLAKHERLKLFFERLAQSPPASSAEGAFALISATLDAIEDAHSGVASVPFPGHDDGRIRGPVWEDSAPHASTPGVFSYRHTHHTTYVGPGGAILLWDRKNKAVILSKSGSDGALLDAQQCVPQGS